MSSNTQPQHPALSILSEYRDYVWEELNSHLKDPAYPPQFPIPHTYSHEHRTYWEMVKDYPERKGKYLRPTLVILACEALGETKEKARKTAAAMQMSEEWILLLDDLMDNSTLRRGKPTHHRLYGIEHAALTVSVLQNITTSILLENEFILGHKKTLKILTEIDKMIMRTAQGQSFEMQWTKQQRFDLSEEDSLFMIDSKTSYYSIAGPLRLGALVAGASDSQLDLLSEFGIYLGRAFQLIDDILGVTSDFDGKKQAGGDIYEGKFTILLCHLLKKLNESESSKVINILKKPLDKKTQSEVEMIISLMYEKGSIEYGKKLANEYKERAYSMFGEKLSFLSNSHAGEKLKIVADFALNRTH